MSRPDAISCLLAMNIRARARQRRSVIGETNFYELLQIADKIDGGTAKVIPFPAPAKAV